MPTNTNKECIEAWIPFVVCVHIRNIYYLPCHLDSIYIVCE